MKNKFDRKEHIKKHKKRIAKIKKEIRDRKRVKQIKEEIRQRRDSENG